MFAMIFCAFFSNVLVFYVLSWFSFTVLVCVCVCVLVFILLLMGLVAWNKIYCIVLYCTGNEHTCNYVCGRVKCGAVGSAHRQVDWSFNHSCCDVSSTKLRISDRCLSRTSSADEKTRITFKRLYSSMLENHNDSNDFSRTRQYRTVVFIIIIIIII